MNKKCTGCKQILPDGSFYKNGKTIRSLCKECTRVSYRIRRIKNIDVHKKKDKNYYQAHKEEIKQKRKEYGAKNKDRVSARYKIMRAVYNGSIIRPNNCSLCKKECVPDAHHEDYSKPLDVVWLCRKCHQIKHNGK